MSKHAVHRISDWPAGYVAELKGGEYWDASDAAVLAELTQYHQPMRFGRHIDLNVQHGFHLEAGDGLVTHVTGIGSGYVIGALGHLGIDIEPTGRVSWSSSEVEKHYVENGPVKLEWALAKAKGPWLLTAEYYERRGCEWYWLILRFFSGADQKAFDLAFPPAAT